MPHATDNRSLSPSPWIAGQTPGSADHDIFLDGRPLPLCIRASPAQGWAVVYRTASDGQIARDCFDRPRTLTLHGQVRICANPCSSG